MDEDGNDKKQHELPFQHSMILQAFKGVDAVMDIRGLTNPRGKWVLLAKIAYEKYFLHKVRAAKTEPYYEKIAMRLIGVE